jgi:hypothetical protein
VDLFEARGQQYLAAVDEYTGWLHLVPLGMDSPSAKVIAALRRIFEAHCAPVVLKPDGGRQLNSTAVQEFLKRWGVVLQTSSPHLSRSNGRAEAAVKALKKMVLGTLGPGQTVPKRDDLLEGLAILRNTPKEGGRSPAEMLYGKAMRDTLPTHPYTSKWRKAFRELDEVAATTRGKKEAAYDAKAIPLGDLKPGEHVLVQDTMTKRWTITGRVVEALPKRDYLIRQTSGRIVRRNRVLLRKRHFVGSPTPHGVTATHPTPPIPPVVVAGPAATPPVPAPTAEAPPPLRRSERESRLPERYRGGDWIVERKRREYIRKQK